MATIEFLEGKRVVHRADNLPHACLANSTYAESMQQAALRQGADGSRTIPDGDGSLERFVRTAARITAELNRETARKNVTHPAIERTFGDLSALLAPLSGYAENFTACEE